KLKSYLAQLEDRECEIVKLQECEKALYANFQASLRENKKFADFLTKVLKKKIKGTEKREVGREAGEGHENEEEDDEESSLSTDEENSGSEDEVFDDSVCPNGCDEALLQNTIQLRQQRLDIEKEKKVAANLRKKCSALANKAKVVETSLDTTNKELETIQWEKQQRLNELDVAVPLKLHQVQYLVNGEMPSDFSQALVFSSSSLESLRKRVGELHNENLMQREIYNTAREQHKQLVRDKKEKEKEIQELEEKCNNLMMKKFGRQVDFEAVQAESVNVHMEKMKVQIMEKEYEHSQELKEWEKRILDLRNQLMNVTNENTSKLKQLHQLTIEKHQLETKLDSL
ncbi:hypothetical protein N310_01035, partial [Acanthisitta chloris]